jgi:serine/threonine-protein kinase RsbW
MASDWAMTLPSDARLLPCVRVFLEALCRQRAIPENVASAIVLATHEAAANVIRHAHRNDPAMPLHIDCTISQAHVEIELCDEGEPFDIDAVPALNPAEVRPGGRGVFLIRTLMDEVSCRRRPEGGNTLRLCKKIAAAKMSARAGTSSAPAP